MLDWLFMKYLSRTGKKAYWIGQITIASVFVYYMLGVAGYSINDDDTRVTLIGGGIAIIIVWGSICVLLWKKKEEPDGRSETTIHS